MITSELVYVNHKLFHHLLSALHFTERSIGRTRWNMNIDENNVKYPGNNPTEEEIILANIGCTYTVSWEVKYFHTLRKVREVS